ncbi:hypothetical protein ACTMU2_04725 [Cupriavidus basilensis]
MRKLIGGVLEPVYSRPREIGTLRGGWRGTVIKRKVKDVQGKVKNVARPDDSTWFFFGEFEAANRG